MTYSVRNMSGTRKQKPERGNDWRNAGSLSPLRFCIRLLAAALLILPVLPDALRAAGEQSGPLLFTSSTRTHKDLEIETKVRRALQKDAQLRPLNLGVRVSGGIATLSGPVPAAEFKQKAIAIVQKLDGVRTVSVKDLYVCTGDPSGKRLSVLLTDDQPMQTRSASSGSLVGSNLDRRFSKSTAGAGGSGQRITLLAPEMGAPNTRAPEAARLTANPRPAPPAASIGSAIENLRQKDLRYQQLRVRVQGATVYVYPSGTAVEDAMTFAQAVRRLPGVQHVIMDSGR